MRFLLDCVEITVWFVGTARNPWVRNMFAPFQLSYRLLVARLQNSRLTQNWWARFRRNHYLVSDDRALWTRVWPWMVLNERKSNSTVIFIPRNIFLLLLAEPVLAAQSNIDLIVNVARVVKWNDRGVFKCRNPTRIRLLYAFVILYTLRFFGWWSYIVKASALALDPIL